MECGTVECSIEHNISVQYSVGQYGVVVWSAVNVLDD